MRQVDPDVVPVYPITPQTPIIQTFAKLVADGKANTEIVNVESEHSAMSAAIGAALAGGRTMTATSSQGLALMAEVVYIAASMRAPIVMALGNRALSGPINIHCDHSDSMLIRDSGVVQLFAEDAQEAYDLMVMAPCIAEDPRVLLPVLVCLDGFTITHSAEPVSLLPDGEVARFVGEYRVPNAVLDTTSPTTQGPFAMPDYYFELRRQQTDDLDAALDVIDEVQARLRAAVRTAELARSRPTGWRTRRAPSSRSARRPARSKTSSTTCETNASRPGCSKLVSFRPFPVAAVATALEGCWRVAALDRADSPGGTPPLHAELAAALYGSGVELDGYVYGLGGRDLQLPDIRAVFSGEAAPYVGLRGERCPV